MLGGQRVTPPMESIGQFAIVLSKNLIQPAVRSWIMVDLTLNCSTNAVRRGKR
jgi:hypothetical protein